MPDQGVVDHRQLELFSPLDTLMSKGLNLIRLLPLTGASIYGSFGSTSRRSLTSTSIVPSGFAHLHSPEAFASDCWWAALADGHLKESTCHFVDEGTA